MNPQRRQFVREVAVGTALMAAVVFAIPWVKSWVVLDNFGVVEPGQFYRSGQLKPYQLEKLIYKYDIRTVINLREPEVQKSLILGEQRVCDQAGVRMVRIPMPGDGRGTYAQYDEVVALLRDPTNRPVLVHCARGSYRTGAVIAAYRVLLQGWREDDAIREMAQYRAHTDDHILIPYLIDYFRSRLER